MCVSPTGRKPDRWVLLLIITTSIIISINILILVIVIIAYNMPFALCPGPASGPRPSRTSGAENAFGRLLCERFLRNVIVI